MEDAREIAFTSQKAGLTYTIPDEPENEEESEAEQEEFYEDELLENNSFINY